MENTQFPSAAEVEQELKREHYKRRYRQVLKSTIFALLTASAAAVLVATLWLPVLQIYGQSMTPTLSDGEIVFSVKSSHLEQGDVVAFYYNNKILIKRVIINNLNKVNDTLAQITEGNLNVTVDVRSNAEFSSLSDDINSTVATLKNYIDEAAARFDKDLEIAKKIQHSALPSVFPPYPNRKDFSIFASMDAAKEVGGDFYDFYLLDEDHLAFVVADVSGKGIPGAMFMMTSKTLIKSHAESGLPVDEVFTQVNAQLCENAKKYGVYDRFEAVLGAADFKADSKIERARAYLESSGENCRVLVVGDLEHDAEMAAEMTCETVFMDAPPWFLFYCTTNPKSSARYTTSPTFYITDVYSSTLFPTLCAL